MAYDNVSPSSTVTGLSAPLSVIVSILLINVYISFVSPIEQRVEIVISNYSWARVTTGVFKENCLERNISNQ